MKYLYILLIISISGNAQKKSVEPDPYQNFKIDNKQLVWQKVYESNLTEDDIRIILNESSIFNPIQGNFSGFTNQFRLLVCPEKGIMPPYVYCDFTAFVNIEIKENKYRITVKEIKFNSCDAMRAWGFPPDKISNIEWYQITDEGEFLKKNQNKKGITCLDQSLSNMFSFKKSTLTNSDW